MESMETLLYILVACVGIILINVSIFHFENFRISAIILCLMLVAFLGINILGQHTDIKELTVYQNGNIEVVGKNIFNDVKTKKYSFFEYNITKSDKNTCFIGSEGEIKLTPKYYEQYQNTINTEKSVNIYIKN